MIEPSLDGVAVAETPNGLVLGEPFKGYPFERPLFRRLLFFPGLPDFRGIDSIGKDLLYILPALPRLGQGDDRVGAKGTLLLFVGKAVLEVPKLAAHRSDQQEQPSAVEQLVRLGGRPPNQPPNILDFST